MIIPKAGGSRRLDGDTTFLLLLHEIRGGCPVMDLTRLVDFTRQLEDSLGSGGLTGINVRKDANISVNG
mgnify:CR=1 FL=1